MVLVHWGKVADLAICNDQLVREPPPTLHLCAGPPGLLPLKSPTLLALWGLYPQGPMKGPAPAPPFPADRRGLLLSNVPLYVVDLTRVTRTARWPRTPGRTAGLFGAAATPPQRPPSPNLRGGPAPPAASLRGGVLPGPWRALGGARGGALASPAPLPTSLCLGRPLRVKQNSESEAPQPQQRGRPMSGSLGRRSRTQRTTMRSSSPRTASVRPLPLPIPAQPYHAPLGQRQIILSRMVSTFLRSLSLISHPCLGPALYPGPLGPSRSPAAPRCLACQGPGSEEGKPEGSGPMNRS